MLVQPGQRWKRGCCRAVVEIEKVVDDRIYFVVVQSDLGWRLGNHYDRLQDNFIDPYDWEYLKGQDRAIA